MIKGNEEEIKKLYRRFKWASETRDSYRRPEWEKASKYLSPAHGRFINSRDNMPGRGKVDRNAIINGTGTRAMAIAVAGIKGGLVPHSLKWFKLGLFDEDMEQWEPAKEWLHSAERIMYSVFNRSNFYESIYMPFYEQLCFGTGPIQILEHPDNIIHCDPWTIGEYALSANQFKEVDTGFREYFVSVRALKQKFGEKNLSSRLKNMLKNNPDQYAKVIHAILPREDRDPDKIDNMNMPWASVWMDSGQDQHVLGESGYRSKPAMYPRWLTIGEDPYGSDCPGLQLLGDVMQLQKQEKDKLAAEALGVNPPMNVPSELWGRLKSFPGAQNPVSKEGNQKIEPTFNVDFNIDHIRQEIRDVEDRIKEGFFNDLFLMLVNTEKSGTTAYEIAKKNEEKLVLLGPVVERQNNELLNPIIERVFDICLHRGMLPDPPEELQGADLRIEYVSLLAQAQKAVGVSGIEKTMGFAGSMMEVFPEVRHKLEPFKILEEYADLTGMSPKLLRSNDEAKAAWQAEQEAMAQQQQAEQMLEGASAVKDLSQARMQDGQSALDKVAEQIPAQLPAP